MALSAAQVAGMRAALTIALAMLGVGAGLGVATASAGGSSDAALAKTRAALQAACFAPDALAARPGEQQVSRGDRRFDKLPKLPDAMAAPAISAPLRGAIRRVDLPKGEKLIALTLDLCEQRGEVAGYEGAIIDTLRREGVKATLFAGGKWLISHSDRAQQLLSDPLFEIGNHSATHRNLRLTDAAGTADEIGQPQRAYEHLASTLTASQCATGFANARSLLAPRISLFRFPFGACNAAALDAVNDAGLLAIQWDVSTGDPDPGQSADAIAHAMVARTKPGSIIIAHANGRGWHTAAALPMAIAKLKARGFTFVTVSELLARGTPVVSPTCYDSHPGDTDRYDNLLRPRALQVSAHPGAKPAPGPARPPAAVPKPSAIDLPWATATDAAPRKPVLKPRSQRRTTANAADTPNELPWLSTAKPAQPAKPKPAAKPSAPVANGPAAVTRNAPSP